MLDAPNGTRPPRLVAIDLDGTLLHSRTHAISPANAGSVRRVRDRGVTVILASGRRHETTAGFAAELGLPADAPVIAYNGALVRTLAGETLSHQPLPADAAARIVRFCAAHGCHLNYYLDDLLYVRAETSWARLYQHRTRTAPRVVGDLTQFDGRRPTKLLLIDTLEVTNSLLAHFQREFGDTLYITKTEDEYLEFMDRGVSKGNALARVAGARGLSAADCAAFGDSYNDISMLSWVGTGIAMANARPELKAVATRTAPPADEDGVAAVLGELFPA